VRTHTLRTWPEAFNAVLCGEKNFEHRKDDRQFRQGDKVILHAWDPATKAPVPDAPSIVADVGFVLRGPAFGVAEGFCVFSLLNPATDRGLIQHSWPSSSQEGGK
jgi:hypothetical protein